MLVLEESVEHIYIFAVIWSLCCTVTFEGRSKFNDLVRKLLKERLSHIKFPEEGNIYNYRYSIEDKNYILWE
jgi:dynein heavy chain